MDESPNKTFPIDPRELLAIFNSTPENSCTEEEEEKDTTDELNLGLSSGGCFGAQESLTRSSSLGIQILQETKDSDHGQLVMPGSVQSRGESSSSLVPQSRPTAGQGSGSSAVPRFPAVIEPNPLRNVQNAPMPPRPRMRVLQHMQEVRDLSLSRAREIGLSALEQMPYVFTTGSSPNGTRIDGVLYVYKRGVEPRIMCVCHGGFHTPQEFVRHAGGEDVDEPLRHITVCTSSPPSSTR